MAFPLFLGYFCDHFLHYTRELYIFFSINPNLHRRRMLLHLSCK